MKIHSNFLVISNYQNDVTWVPEYTNNYLIYDQNETQEMPEGVDPAKVIKSQHTGHNISDHLRFIIDHYDNLPDCTIFAKGNIFPRHIAQKNFDALMNNSVFTPIEDLETNTATPNISYFQDGGFNEINNDWYAPIVEKRVPSRYANTLNKFLRLLFVNPELPKFVRFTPGANFILPRDLIRKYPKVFYQNLQTMVSYGILPVEAYFTERSLFTIWTKNYTLTDIILATPMRPLDEISRGYGTDKSSLFHNYTKLYSLYFDEIRQESLKILEIGIDKGFSLKTWKEYFAKSEITGIDILDLKHFEEERVHVVQADQKDVEALKKVNEQYGPFDIIIDDGSHHNEDMKASFECLFPLLKAGGIYVVEDLHACYWGETHNTGKPVFMDLLKKLLDDVNSGGKSGVANIQRDKEDGWYQQKRMPEMTWWEKNVEFVHLYRSIVFIKKYPPMNERNPFTRKGSYVMVGNVQQPSKSPTALSAKTLLLNNLYKRYRKLIGRPL